MWVQTLGVSCLWKGGATWPKCRHLCPCPLRSCTQNYSAAIHTLPLAFRWFPFEELQTSKLYNPVSAGKTSWHSPHWKMWVFHWKQATWIIRSLTQWKCLKLFLLKIFFLNKGSQVASKPGIVCVCEAFALQFSGVDSQWDVILHRPIYFWHIMNIRQLYVHRCLYGISIKVQTLTSVSDAQNLI